MKGLTLIEALIVLAIVVIVVILAAEGYRGYNCKRDVAEQCARDGTPAQECIARICLKCDVDCPGSDVYVVN